MCLCWKHLDITSWFLCRYTHRTADGFCENLHMRIHTQDAQYTMAPVRSRQLQGIGATVWHEYTRPASLSLTHKAVARLQLCHQQSRFNSSFALSHSHSFAGYDLKSYNSRANRRGISVHNRYPPRPANRPIASTKNYGDCVSFQTPTKRRSGSALPCRQGCASWRHHGHEDPFDIKRVTPKGRETKRLHSLIEWLTLLDLFREPLQIVLRRVCNLCPVDIKARWAEKLRLEDRTAHVTHRPTGYRSFQTPTTHNT
jgi:hypothetical protein